MKSFLFIAIAAILLIFFGCWSVQKNKKVSFVEQTKESIAFSADSIKVEVPQPGEHIKGTLFNFRGRVQSKNEDIFVKIIDSNGFQAMAGKISLKNSDFDGWKLFDEKFNLIGRSGWFRLEVSESGESAKLADFKIRIVPSI